MMSVALKPYQTTVSWYSLQLNLFELCHILAYVLDKFPMFILQLKHTVAYIHWYTNVDLFYVSKVYKKNDPVLKASLMV